MRTKAELSSDNVYKHPNEIIFNYVDVERRGNSLASEEDRRI